MHLRPGQKVQVVEYGSRIELVPIGPISTLRGFAKGIEENIDREPDRL
jgi:hypothetical protein